MQTYVAILRGINVGGKTLKMADLRNAVEKKGLKNVSTYIQSGNLFFQYHDEIPKILEHIIRDIILLDFGINVSVIVLTPEKLKKIIDNNPFKNDSIKEPSFLHVTFLQTTPKNYDKKSILNKTSGREEIAFTSEAVYLYCPNGYGNSKLNNNLLENKLKITATTRNWKTTIKLLELATAMV